MYHHPPFFPWLVLFFPGRVQPLYVLDLVAWSVCVVVWPVMKCFWHMEMIYRPSLASWLFRHTNWLNKHVRAKYRPGENPHGCFGSFFFPPLVDFRNPYKDVKIRLCTWRVFPWITYNSGYCTHHLNTSFIHLDWGGGGPHCVCTGKTRVCIVFVCACAQGPWRGYRDGRLHQAGDSTSGLQFQELLHWDGVKSAGKQRRGLLQTVHCTVHIRCLWL